jgi:hypothetical protein
VRSKIVWYEDEVGGTHGTSWGGRCIFRVLVGIPEGKRPLGRLRCRWEDNIKIGLREIGLDGANWISWLRTGSSGELL